MKTKTMNLGEMIDDFSRELGLVETSTVDWLSANDIARELKMHINTVYRIIQSGQLKSYNCSVEGKKNYYRIKRVDLEEYLEQRYCRW